MKVKRYIIMDRGADNEKITEIDKMSNEEKKELAVKLQVQAAGESYEQINASTSNNK